MGFLTSLFGGTDNSFLTVILALAAVIVLIVLGLWLLKLIFRATGNVGRGRNRRLAIIDSMALDPKRQLVLVRRDNVEHLVLLGGTADLVVETGINPSAAAEMLKRPRAQTPDSEVPRLKPVATLAETEIPEPQAEMEPHNDSAAKSARSLRHTGLFRAAFRQEPGFNPQPLDIEPSFDEAEHDDSAKSETGTDDEVDTSGFDQGDGLEDGASVQEQPRKRERPA